MTETASITFRADPRVKVSDADRAAQLAFGNELRDALNRMADAVHQIQDLRTQLRERNTALAGHAARLRGEADIKGKVEQDGEQPDRDAEGEQVLEPFPAPARGEGAPKDIRASQQGKTDQDVPGVQESHATQEERAEEEMLRTHRQAVPTQVHLSHPATQEQVHRCSGKQQAERHGQDMRVQVAQQVGEEREFINDLSARACQVKVRYHA